MLDQDQLSEIYENTLNEDYIDEDALEDIVDDEEIEAAADEDGACYYCGEPIVSGLCSALCPESEDDEVREDEEL